MHVISYRALPIDGLVGYREANTILHASGFSMMDIIVEYCATTQIVSVPLIADSMTACAFIAVLTTYIVSVPLIVDSLGTFSTIALLRCR